MKTAIILLFLLGTLLSSSQEFGSKEFKKLYKEANVNLAENKLKKAKTIFENLYEKNPKNHNLSYKLAYCYYLTQKEKKISLKYFTFALQNTSNSYKDKHTETSAPKIALFYFAEVQHFYYNLDKAISNYTLFITECKKNNDILYKYSIERAKLYIKHCEYAKKLLEGSEKEQKKVYNLDFKLNSGFSDHSPVYIIQDSSIIFTSKRYLKHGEEVATNLNLDTGTEYDENVYISKLIDGKWSKATPIKGINGPLNDATSTISSDGKTMFFFKNENGKGRIYQGEYKNGAVSKLKKLPDQINMPKRDIKHAVFSYDKKSIFFVSSTNKKNGFGGFDIFVSELKDSTWGEAKNLGEHINTEYDERSPFLHPQGDTLYFASNRKESMGGFDIFYSTKNKNGNWGKPVNMGVRVNSTGDDIFFIMSPDAKYAYFSSNNKGTKIKKYESHGNMDIYLERPIPNIFLNCIVIDQDDQPIDDPNLDVFKNSDNKSSAQFVNKNKNQYKYILNADEFYKIFAEKEFYSKYSENLSIPFKFANQVINKTIKLVRVVDEEIVLETDHILYPFDEFETDKYYHILNTLSDYLYNNPNAILKITGHTDSKGSVKYNEKLARNRARFVKNYILKKYETIKEEQVQIDSKGELQPIAINKYKDGKDCPGGRLLNRRSFIQVMTQGKIKLNVRQIIIPKEFQRTDIIIKKNDE